MNASVVIGVLLNSPWFQFFDVIQGGGGVFEALPKFLKKYYDTSLVFNMLFVKTTSRNVR